MDIEGQEIPELYDRIKELEGENERLQRELYECHELYRRGTGYQPYTEPSNPKPPQGGSGVMDLQAKIDVVALKNRIAELEAALAEIEKIGQEVGSFSDRNKSLALNMVHIAKQALKRKEGSDELAK